MQQRFGTERPLRRSIQVIKLMRMTQNLLLSVAFLELFVPQVPAALFLYLSRLTIRVSVDMTEINSGSICVASNLELDSRERYAQFIESQRNSRW